MTSLSIYIPCWIQENIFVARYSYILTCRNFLKKFQIPSSDTGNTACSDCPNMICLRLNLEYFASESIIRFLWYRPYQVNILILTDTELQLEKYLWHIKVTIGPALRNYPWTHTHTTNRVWIDCLLSFLNSVNIEYFGKIFVYFITIYFYIFV